jgi:predicted DCC family thiol-disulfide oxidoreductase YuxK
MRIPVSRLGNDLVDRLQGHDVIVFDGECVLCSRFFRFVLRHDTAARFSFATAQSDIGQKCYAALGMPLDDFQTNLVILDGVIHTDLDAFAAVMGCFAWPWKTFKAAALLPAIIKVPAYRMIASNRYRLFGRLDTCLVPDMSVRGRFFPGGFQ